jgi:hypothetical protein
MRKLMILAGIAVLAAGSPAVAKPDHAKGHGKGHKQETRYDRRDDDRRYDRRDDRRYDRRASYGGRNCPPGLAKKNNGCRAPGQARKLARGQRYQNGYGTAYGYNQLPYNVRRQYNLDQSNRYYYDDGTLYGVDRQSGIIEQVLSTLLR